MSDSRMAEDMCSDSLLYSRARRDSSYPFGDGGMVKVVVLDVHEHQGVLFDHVRIISFPCREIGFGTDKRNSTGLVGLDADIDNDIVFSEEHLPPCQGCQLF